MHRRTCSARSARLGHAAVALLAVSLLATGCSSGSSGPTAAEASSSANSSILPTPPGTVKDSIEDVNSTKDMTGVVTTLSNDANPYVRLIPYVCPFLPDSITRGKLGMADIITGFQGQHDLLNLCNMQGTPRVPGGAQERISVTIQATSFADVSASPTHTDIAKNVPIWRNVTGLVYKNAGDDSAIDKVCNLVWGTFYGTAVVTAFSSFGYRADPCTEVVKIARLVAPLLPSKPTQMRPTEG